MNFDLTEEQTMLRDGTRRYLREQYTFETWRRAVLVGPGGTPAHWPAFAELGWLALGIPESAGGLGCAFTDTCLIMESFGHALVLEPYTSTAILCARILEHSHNTTMRDRLLAGIAAGQNILGLAHEEPGISHQRHTANTLARRVAAGFALSGAKTTVFDALLADHFIISAQLDDGDFALFLVPAQAHGLKQMPYRLIDGTHAADLTFDAVALNEQSLLLRGNDARAALDDALDRAVLAQVAESLGAMCEVLRITADHLKTRHQFGQPLGKFQALQHRMAEMFTQTQSVRSILYHGLASIDASPLQRRAAVSAAKVASAEAGFFVGGQGIQLHGGMGMTDEYPVGHYFKRLVALEKAYGDAAWHLARYTALRFGQTDAAHHIY